MSSSVKNPNSIVTIDRHQAAVLSWMQEIAPYGILTTDADLRIQSWNDWLETHSGLAAPLVIGRPLGEVFPELRARKLDDHFRRALAGEVIVLSAVFHGYLLPFPSTHREGGFAQMQQTARIAPLALLDQSVGTITIIEDVSQREAQTLALARRQQRDQLLASCLAHLLRARDPQNLVQELFPDIAAFLGVDTFVVYVLEPDGKHLRLHASAGLPDQQKAEFGLIGLDDSVSGLTAAQRRPFLVENLQTSSDPNSRRGRALGLRAVASHPLLVGDRLIGTLAFARRDRDTFTAEEIQFMTTIAQYMAVALDRAFSEAALRQAQQALSEHAENLEIKVDERTAKLRDTVAQLETFSYTVAHDLGAPIRALKGYAQVLLDESSTTTPDRSRLYLQRIERAANRLEVLTRDLLQFSTVSRQDVPLTSIDLADLVHDLRLLRPALQEQALTVQEPLIPVLAHRTLLQQCLSNLLDNALKFMTPGVEPRIVLRTEKVAHGPAEAAQSPPQAFNPAIQRFEEGKHAISASAGTGLTQRVRIWVEDNGIGVATESREKIFGIFERLNSPDKYEGTGIGLAIVARAVQRMGGSCGVEPGREAGCRFWLELLPAPEPVP